MSLSVRGDVLEPVTTISARPGCIRCVASGARSRPLPAEALGRWSSRPPPESVNLPRDLAFPQGRTGRDARYRSVTQLGWGTALAPPTLQG